MISARSVSCECSDTAMSDSVSWHLSLCSDAVRPDVERRGRGRRYVCGAVGIVVGGEECGRAAAVLAK